MVSFFRTWVTFIVTATIVVSSMLPSVCGAPASQVEQTAETNRGDCLPNQFLSPSSLTCENCTICLQGMEHSPKGQCGYGWGVETTCTPCADGFFQAREGYTDLVCSRCVTCDPNVKYRQNCTPTQDARCGPCPPGKYEFLENICLECKENPSHADCLQTSEPTPIKHSASPNQPAPTTTSGNTTPSPLSSQAHNTSNDEHGTPTTKFTWYSGVIVVCTIVICVILLASLALYKKWKAENTNGNVLPSKSPAEESGPLIPTSALVIATPTPAITTPASDDAIATPAPDIATPDPAITTPKPVTAPPINDLLQGASNPGDQLAASLPSEVSNIEISLPGALSSDGGACGDMYQNPPNHVPGSPDSAKDNFVFEDDDGSMSLPGPLMS